MSSGARAVAKGLTICALGLFAGPASADDLTKQQCVEANESAQTHRQEGKLQAARIELLICLSKSCPGPVRDDCTERLAELDRSAPTVVFVVKGADGRPLRDVEIAMDGARIADHLDAAPLVVDPGAHQIVFAADGYATSSKKVVFREAVKGRRVEVLLSRAATAMTTAVKEPELVATAPPPPADDSMKSAPASGSTGTDQRIVGYLLGGAGIVGLGIGTAFLITANQTHNDVLRSANCPGPSCQTQDLDTANRELLVSQVAFGAGGVLLVAGVVVFLTAPKDAPKGAAIFVRPSVGPSSAGVKLGGAF